MSRRVDPYDQRVRDAMMGTKESSSDYLTYGEDPSQVSTAGWRILYARRSHHGQRARRLRRLASRADQ